MKEQILKEIQSVAQNEKLLIESVVTDVLDSLTFIKVVVYLERTFNVEFDDDKLLLSEFENIGSLIDYVLSKNEHS